MNYPVRCKIIDVTNIEVFPGIMGNNPEKSMPHIGKKGTVYEHVAGVRIVLDDGNILYGYECWWIPIKEK